MCSRRSTTRACWLVFSLLLLAACADDTDQALKFEQHLARSADSIARGDTNSAIIELKNALQLRGEHLEARARLAGLYLDKGEYANAEKEFRFLRSQGGEPETYLTGLNEAFLHLSEWQEVLENTDPARIRQLPPPDHARALAQRGSAYIGLDRLDLAREAFTQALAVDEHSIPAWLGQAALAVGEGQRASARVFVRQALPKATGADLVEAWRLTAELDRLEGDLASAENAYGKALELGGGTNLPIRLARFHLRIEAGELLAAQEDLGQIPGRYRRHPHVLYAHGLLAVRQQHYSVADEYLRELRNTDPNHLFGLYYLGISQLGMNRPEDAEGFFSQAAVLAPRSRQIAFMLGQTRYQLGKYRGAAEVLEPLLAASPNDPRLQSLLGSVYLALGNTRHAQQLLEQSVLQQPDIPHERMKLGLSLVTLGEHDDAIAELELAARDSEQAPQIQVALVTANLRAGRHDAAREVVHAMQAQQPDEASYWNLLGLVEMAAGRQEAGKTAFEKALELQPRLASARYNLAQYHLGIDARETARDQLHRLLEYHPEHLQTLMALTQLEAREGRQEAASNHATRAMNHHPDQLAPRLWLARERLAAGKPADSLQLLQAVGDHYRENTGYLALLGEAQLLAGNTTDAVPTFRELVRQSPRQALGHYMLARACAMDRAYECLRESLVTALGIDDSYPGLLELVHHAISMNNETSSVGKLLWRLQHAAPDNLQLIGLRAQFALRQNRYGEAMAILEGALDRFPEEWSLHAMTARALARNQDPEAALALLHDWLRRHPEDQEALLLGAMIHVDNRDSAQAIGAFEKVLAVNPDHYQALNNLAWLLREQDLPRARIHAERAHELAPGYITRDTLGVILYLQGEYERAERLLRSAFGEQPHSRPIRHHLARVLVERRLEQEARALLEEILRDGEPFEGRDEADALLKTLLG